MTFAIWLARQIDREDLAGCLAKKIETARPKTPGLSTFGAALTRYIERGTGREILDLTYAYKEYITACANCNIMHEMVRGLSTD